LARIDLNADVGEGYGAWSLGADEELFAFVSSANVACGFHAGDPRLMDRTVARALASGVAIGAHPSHPDLRGFGRRALAATPEDVETDVLYQIGALAAFAAAHGTRLSHVKPHGALYNQAADDPALAQAIARAIARFDPQLALVGLAGSDAMREAAEDGGLRFVAEGFVDRAYDARGRLLPRREAGAVLDDPQAAARQALAIACEGRVSTRDGTAVELHAQTLCLHGDNPKAVAIARAVRVALERAGVEVLPLDA
jgi:UPF0271 protein